MVSKIKLRPIAAGLATVFACALSGGVAHAVTCESLNLPNPIYGAGGSAITPTLAAVALQLSKAEPPITVFYADPGAQKGYDAFAANAIKVSFKYWTKDADLATPPTCDPVDATAGQPADFGSTGGSLALFGETLPDGIGQFSGPAQGVNIIVPKDQQQDSDSISTEALYDIFGFGDGSQAFHWSDKRYIFQRGTSSFVQQFIRGTVQTLGGPAAAFPASFPGASPSAPDSNQGTVDSINAAVALATTARDGSPITEAAIGFTSGPTADKNRKTVKTLAYQHTGQTCGYWPDSTADAFDKINIRTGQYFLWDVNLFFARIDGSNKNAALSQIKNETVRTFIGYFSGEVAPPTGVDVNSAITTTGSIPLCAMRVKRDGDFGALSSYAPAEPCGCAFEAIATKAPTCDACTVDKDCKNADAPACHFGYCEAY